MIPITKPFLPPKQEYVDLLDTIWSNRWLTNMGPLASSLEERLSDRFQLEHLLYVTNGTIALQMAIKALRLSGEIITTPFSFIATTSSIKWEGCKPVFADIDRHSLNIDVNKIESLITEETSAILATHVYGNPCEIDKIQEIANKHNLKVIYDAAHAFGVSYKGKSIFDYGDISVCSLHATKLYHSIEGGLVIAKDAEIAKRLKSIRNFGFNGPEDFSELGINAKNSEYHAAMGLINLNYIDKIKDKRMELAARYDQNLATLSARKVVWNKDGTENNAYYSLIFDDEAFMLACIKRLEENKIYSRRYFYPSLSSSLPYLENTPLDVVDELVHKVLCLPLYYDLRIEDVDFICKILTEK